MAFLAGLGIGYFTRIGIVGTLQRRDARAADLAAIEVISGESTYKTSAKDNPITVAGKSMRVLNRQSDGSWKFALVGLK